MNTLKTLAILSLIAIQVLNAIETPDYQVVQQLGDKIEVRKYSSSKWVSTKTTTQLSAFQTSTLFGKLFSYISGNNNAQKKIDMTAPVLNQMKSLNGQQITRDSMVDITMNFYVPKVNQASTPVPNAQDVFIQSEPEATFAVIQFSGYAMMSDYLKHRDMLVEALGGDASQYDTINMLTAGYSAPNVIIGRINEVWLKKF